MARVRRVAGTQERLLASPYTITQPHALRGHCRMPFRRRSPSSSRSAADADAGFTPPQPVTPS